MTLTELITILPLKIVAGGEALEDKFIEYAFASDLMSDVLTLDRNGILLITGLANVQAIRTAEMADVTAVIIARGKKATPAMISLAEEIGLILLESDYSMFRISGELFERGIKAVY